MNLLPKVAEMLGVKIGERFKIWWNDCTEVDSAVYQFTEKRFQYRKESDTLCTEWEESFAYTDLISGIAKVVKLPFKPKDGEQYWYVYVGDDDIGSTSFSEANTNDLMRVYCGNCFRTEAEAKEHKHEIYEKLTGKKWTEVTF